MTVHPDFSGVTPLSQSEDSAIATCSFFFVFVLFLIPPLETIHLGSLYDHLLVWGIILVCDYNEVILGWVACKSLGDLSAAR